MHIDVCLSQYIDQASMYKQALSFLATTVKLQGSTGVEVDLPTRTAAQRPLDWPPTWPWVYHVLWVSQ